MNSQTAVQPQLYMRPFQRAKSRAADSWKPLSRTLPTRIKPDGPTTQLEGLPKRPLLDSRRRPTTDPDHIGLGPPQRSFASSNARTTSARPIGEQETTLWMGDLEPWMNEDYVRNLWFHMGEHVKVKMIKDKFLDTNEGYCFVDFASRQAASKALKLDGLRAPNALSHFNLIWASVFAAPNAFPKQGGFPPPVGDDPPFSMRRFDQSVIKSHSDPVGERTNQFLQAQHDGRQNVNPFGRQDSRTDHPKFTSAFRNPHQYLSGYPKRSPVHFTTNGELDEDAPLDMFRVDDNESMTGITTTWPHDTEYSSQPNMFISYTLSEDRTGDQDSVMAARLTALGERHKHTGFASASLALLGRR